MLAVTLFRHTLGLFTSFIAEPVKQMQTAANCLQQTLFDRFL